MARAKQNRQKYLQRVTDKKGVTRIYFRAGGVRPKRMPAEGSAEFKKLYDDLVAKLDPNNQSHHTPIIKTVACLPGTIGWFVERYLASAEFKALKGGTQYTYRKRLDQIRERLGVALLVTLDPENVDFYTGEIAREYSPSVADNHRVLLSNLWNFAKGFREFKRGGKSNPTIDTTKRYKVKSPRRPWPETEQEKFLATAKPPVALASCELSVGCPFGPDRGR